MPAGSSSWSVQPSDPSCCLGQRALARVDAHPVSLLGPRQVAFDVNVPISEWAWCVRVSQVNFTPRLVSGDGAVISAARVIHHSVGTEDPPERGVFTGLSVDLESVLAGRLALRRHGRVAIADRITIEPMDNREVVANLVVRMIAATCTAYSIIQPTVTFPDRSGPQVNVYRLSSPDTGARSLPVASTRWNADCIYAMRFCRRRLHTKQIRQVTDAPVTPTMTFTMTVTMMRVSSPA